jgi:hypothetical protein
MFIKKTIKSIIMIRKFTYLFFILLTTGLVAQTSVADSPLFTTTTNATWTYVFTAVKTSDSSSGEAQTIVVNVTSLPTGGANYRVIKSLADNSQYNGNSQPLSMGQNTISIPGVTFSRYVKIQVDSGDIEFDVISVNDGTTDSQDVDNSSLFADVSSTTWPYEYTLPPLNGGAQTVVINITSLPAAGTQWRRKWTKADNSLGYCCSSDLGMGENTVSFGAVAWNRSSLVMMTNGDVKFDNITVNGSSVLSLDKMDNSSITLYPNPASGIITVSGVENIKSIKVFSLLGSLEIEVLNANQVDVSGLSKGIHMITVDNGTVFTKKFIVK